jgi:hypothetical protein
MRKVIVSGLLTAGLVLTGVVAAAPAQAADTYVTPVDGKLIIGDLQLFVTDSAIAGNVPGSISCTYSVGIKSCRTDVYTRLLVVDATTGNHVSPDRVKSITGRVVSDKETYAGPTPGPTTDWKQIESFTNVLSQDGSKPANTVGFGTGHSGGARYDNTKAEVKDGDISYMIVLFHHFESELSDSDKILARQQIRYVEYTINGVKVLYDYDADTYLAKDPYASTSTGDGGTDQTPTSKNLSDAGALLSVVSPAWTGKTISSFTVKSGSTVLKEGVDYTISVSGNTKAVGTVKVTITGKGDYSGTKTVTVKILPSKVGSVKAKVGKKTVKVSWKKLASSQKVGGYQVSYRVKGTSKWITKKVAASKASLTVKKLKTGKKYQVRVRGYKGSLYGAWSITKTSAKVK